MHCIALYCLANLRFILHYFQLILVLLVALGDFKGKLSRGAAIQLEFQLKVLHDNLVCIK